MTAETDSAHSIALDPIDRISEIIFGLIMVLTFTGTLSVATAGREDVREMLLAALGCNLVWGIIDALLFLMSTRTERGHNVYLLKKLRATADPAEGRAMLFAAGYSLGSYTGGRASIWGGLTAVVGVAVVALTIALGG